MSELHRQLRVDAERILEDKDGDFRREWADQMRWEQYIGENSRALYLSFSDEELLDVLRAAAEDLGKIPARKDVFCIYRIFIRRRFKNWPSALRAAGLMPARADAAVKNDKCC